MSLSRAVVLSVIALVASSIDAQSIFTVAGGADLEGRPAISFPLTTLYDVAVDSRGNVYVSDGDSFRVRVISADTGLIHTIAGNGTKGSAGDGGPATAAAMTPSGVAVDRAGNVYVVDSEFFNESIRRVDAATGIITTVAGGGHSIANGIPATDYSLISPEDVHVASNGDIYIAAQPGIHKVDAATGLIHLIAGGGEDPPTDGAPATAAQMHYTRDVTLDELANALYIADFWNRRVRKVDLASGLIYTIAGGGTSFGDGSPATSIQLSVPDAVVVSPSGDVLVADSQSNRVWRIEMSSGLIRHVAGTGGGGESGDGGLATRAQLSAPNGLSFDGLGHLNISDSNNGRVRRVDPSGTITTVAGAGLGSGFQFVGDGGPGTAATLFTSSTGSLFAFNGLALDADGNLFIADTDNHRIRKLDGATGVISTFAGTGVAGAPREGAIASESTVNAPAGLAVDPQGNLFFSDWNANAVYRIDAGSTRITRIAGGGSGGDGEPATSASLSRPAGLVVDSVGSVLIADGNRVRKVDPATGLISTIAGTGTAGFSGGDGGPATLATLESPTGLAIDGNGDLFIAERFGNVVRKVTMRTGMISTVVGSGWPFYQGDGVAATSAGMGECHGIGVDGFGNLFLSEASGSRLHKVEASTGILRTISGQREEIFDFLPIYSGDNGPAVDATLGQPEGIAVSAAGDVFVMDTNSNRVRVIYSCRDVGPPELLSPADGSAGLQTATRLEWRAVPGAIRYDVYLDTDSPPKALAAKDIETTSISAFNLQPLTTYYWKVVASGDRYCSPHRSAASAERSFTTSSECRAPVSP
jgi:sugar lactone lactonase YvrE